MPEKYNNFNISWLYRDGFHGEEVLVYITLHYKYKWRKVIIRTNPFAEVPAAFLGRLCTALQFRPVDSGHFDAPSVVVLMADVVC